MVACSSLQHTCYVLPPAANCLLPAGDNVQSFKCLGTVKTEEKHRTAEQQGSEGTRHTPRPTLLQSSLLLAGPSLEAAGTTNSVGRGRQMFSYLSIWYLEFLVQCMNNHTRQDIRKEISNVPGTPDSIQQLAVIRMTTASIQEVASIVITASLSPRYLSRFLAYLGENVGHPMPFL